MKAAVLAGPRQVEIREVTDPISPEDGLLLKVMSCGVCGSDLRRWREGPLPGSRLVVPGHEIGGVVLDVGESVRGYARGERLAVAPDIHCGECYYCRRGKYNLCDNIHMLGITPGYDGGFAEKLVLTGEMLAGGIVHSIPDELSFAEGALAEPCSSVLAAHAGAGTSVGDSVLVIGAGPIGCLHVAISRARGATVFVSQRSEKRREMARLFQPDAVIDPSAEDVVARVQQLTDGRGVDIAICANGVAATQETAVESVRKGGRVVLFGGLPRSSPMTTLDSNRIHYGEIQVVGSFSYHPTFHKLALNLMRRKLVPSDLLISHTFSLDHIREAFDTAASRNGLKVMVAA